MHTLYQWIETFRLKPELFLPDNLGEYHAQNDLINALHFFLPEITEKMKDELIALVGKDEKIPSRADRGSNEANILILEQIRWAEGFNFSNARLRTAINNYFEKRV